MLVREHSFLACGLNMKRNQCLSGLFVSLMGICSLCQTTFNQKGIRNRASFVLSKIVVISHKYTILSVFRASVYWMKYSQIAMLVVMFLAIQYPMCRNQAVGIHWMESVEQANGHISTTIVLYHALNIRSIRFIRFFFLLFFSMEFLPDILCWKVKCCSHRIIHRYL